jgi:hypothetical protein
MSRRFISYFLVPSFTATAAVTVTQRGFFQPTFTTLWRFISQAYPSNFEAPLHSKSLESFAAATKRTQVFQARSRNSATYRLRSAACRLQQQALSIETSTELGSFSSRTIVTSDPRGPLNVSAGREEHITSVCPMLAKTRDAVKKASVLLSYVTSSQLTTSTLSPRRLPGHQYF